VGVDIVRPAELPLHCEFIHTNVLNLGCENRHWFSTVDDCGLVDFNRGFDFIVASSPLRRVLRPRDEAFPTLTRSIPRWASSCSTTRARSARASGVPYVMENVRAAQRFVGNAVHHCGPYFSLGQRHPFNSPARNQEVFLLNIA